MSAPPPSASGFRVLAEATRALHVEVESRLELKSALHSKASYADMLAILFRWWSPAEASLDRFEWPEAVEWPKRRRAHVLEGDLRRLGHPIPAPGPEPLVRSIDEAWGWLYVLEGSTLGGRIISRMLAAELAIGPNDGGAFHHGYGDDGGPMWRTLGRCFEAHLDRREPERTAALEAASSGAQAAFLSLLNSAPIAG